MKKKPTALEALEAIAPYVFEDFPHGLGDDHGTCASNGYLEAARMVQDVLGYGPEETN